MTVKFKHGDLVGPIMGNGGMLGDGASHLPPTKQAQIALHNLRAIQRFHKRGRDISRVVYAPLPGHLALYPEFCAASSGPMVPIPVGDEITIARGES